MSARHVVTVLRIIRQTATVEVAAPTKQDAVFRAAEEIAAGRTKWDEQIGETRILNILWKGERNHATPKKDR